ncbi:ABC transporter substrate-binding protein [Alkalihalobacterium chitinilyticum]|uniref:ABC transporter substrate-binding protein n=1 Tax=Alkalihalobacterium chitinilyticum TaxID=2980103 RepID=A0ABT5VD72_9BACI|nr:ABC transporter substrate-binding protein [Alkalihalobacterium chitinilyticum]MDE5413391.1 ABC transporter substrate-binding protein [Alkalihalobacterium chitinilyticum]
MKLTEHYLQLREALAAVDDYQAIQITIEELAEILHCTPRYVKRLIKEMKSNGWLEWEVSYGRGKRPTLTFLKSKDAVTFEVSKLHIETGAYKEGLQLLHTLNSFYQQKLNEWIQEQFGYIEHRNSEEQLDILRYPFYHAIHHLDPAHLKSIHENHLADHIFDTLLTFNPRSSAVEPHLAHHWEVDDTGKVWTFYLRKGVLFQHGRELTADDVKATFERLIETPFHNKWMIRHIKEIRLIKKYVVQFILDRPEYLFPNALCNKQLSIIPMEVYNENPEQFTKLPIGSGPFKLTKHDDSMLRLDAHSSYFQGRPHLDRVEIITLLQMNEQEHHPFFHYFNQVTDKDQPMAWKEIEHPEEGATYLSFNLFKSGVHQNKKIREAIRCSINRDQMCRDLLGERYFPADSQLIHITENTYNNPYDPAKAKRLLKEAGYNGEKITLYATQLRKNAHLKKEALWLKDHLENSGLVVEVHVVPIDELIRKETLAEADIILAGMALGMDIQYSLLRFFQLPGSFIKALLGPELSMTFQKELVHIQHEPNSLTRYQLLIDLEQLLKDEITYIPLFHRSHHVQVNQASPLSGVTLESYGKVSYKKLWFKT